MRLVYNHQDGSPIDDDRYGFENTRTQLFFEGHVVDPSWTYRIQGDFARSGGAFTLLDAWARKAFANGFAVSAGQYRMPLLREFLVVETTQLAVDRSLVHQTFSGQRTQGVLLEYQPAPDSKWRASASIDDGVAATGGGANSPWNAEDVEWSLSSRAELLLAGEWSAFADFSSFPGTPKGAMIGAAIHAQQSESGTVADEGDLIIWTVDGSLELDGANVFAAFVGRSIETAGVDQDQYGLVLQGGIFVTDAIEPYARFEWGDSDDGAPDLMVLTFGVNAYFARHRLEWTTDIGIGLDEVSATWGGSSGNAVGWRTDAPDESGQIVLRSQMQLAF